MADENRTQQVSLGCGTLILIALIVMIFSWPRVDEIQSEVQGLQSEVPQLKGSVEPLSEQIRLLRRSSTSRASRREPQWASRGLQQRENPMPFEDKLLVCEDCGADFSHTAEDQARYAERGFTSEPKRCRPCREKRGSSS